MVLLKEHEPPDSNSNHANSRKARNSRQSAGSAAVHWNRSPQVRSRAGSRKPARRWPQLFSFAPSDSQLGSAARITRAYWVRAHLHRGVEALRRSRDRRRSRPATGPAHPDPGRIEFWLDRPHRLPNGAVSFVLGRIGRARCSIRARRARAERRLTRSAAWLRWGWRYSCGLKGWATWRRVRLRCLGSLAITHSTSWQPGTLSAAGRRMPADEDTASAKAKPSSCSRVQGILIVLSGGRSLSRP